MQGSGSLDPQAALSPGKPESPIALELDAGDLSWDVDLDVQMSLGSTPADEPPLSRAGGPSADVLHTQPTPTRTQGLPAATVHAIRPEPVRQPGVGGWQTFESVNPAPGLTAMEDDDGFETPRCAQIRMTPSEGMTGVNLSMGTMCDDVRYLQKSLQMYKTCLHPSWSMLKNAYSWMKI